MLTISSQQAAFYTKNGFLELEEVYSLPECEMLLTEIQQTIQARDTPSLIRARDLWRETPLLKKNLLSKKQTQLVFSLTRKPALRLAFDQWFEPGFSLKAPEKIEKLFSIQGLACILFIQLEQTTTVSPLNQLGLFPFPHSPGNVLITKPSLLINWPPQQAGLYCVGYSLSNAVYVQNLLDPANLSLRKFGYGYGDILRNDTHPLITA